VFDTVEADSSGSYNKSTGLYTCPVSGYYRVSAQINYSVNMSGVASYIYLWKNGAQYAVISQCTNTGTGGTSAGAIDFIKCNAGDTLGIYGLQSSGATQGFYGTAANPWTWATFTRLSGPSVVAATESVTMAATTSTTSMPSATYTTVIFSNRAFDSHSAYSTSNGVFTAPVSGKYQVNASITIPNATPQSANCGFGVYINVNGTRTQGAIKATPNTQGMTYSAQVSGIVNVLAGQTISIQGWQNLSAGSLSLSSALDPSENNLSIVRVGN
jgi:hypothetical protein